ncbi:MAG: DUF1523 family protein [Mangrovicoccus sp.]|nr:DUF1523 family protein [Mangrovicoccus sp.]
MKFVIRTLMFCVILAVAATLHYTLPRHDVVRIVEAENRRVQFDSNSIFWGSAEPTDLQSGTRDVKFISAFRENGKPMVYRNEDTGWGWPPYFKLNSADLQAHAANLKSTQEDPEWVMVTRYGWRNQFLSIYPNAVKLKPVEGPDASVFPWFNTIFLTLLAGFLLFIWRLWVRFRTNRIDPVLEDVGEAIDRVDDRMDAAADRAQGFWQRLFGGKSSGSGK